MTFKYRAWHIQEKKMYMVGEIMWSKGKVVDVELLAKDGIHSENTVEGHDVILMPNIGLTDSNGKEIYEDDFIELTYKLYPKRPPIKCVIMWLDYKACFRAVKSKNFIANVGNTDKYVTKIIGNIHKNPELIDSIELTTWYPLNKRQIFFQAKAAKK